MAVLTLYDPVTKIAERGRELTGLAQRAVLSTEEEPSTARNLWFLLETTEPLAARVAKTGMSAN